MAKAVKFQWRGTQVMDAVRGAASRGLDKGMVILHKEVVRLITKTPKTGRMYGSHQASAPGEPPATHFGTHLAGFKIQKTGPLKASLINTDPNHARLELGTQNMRPRPHMIPALTNVASKILEAINNEVATTLARRK